MNGRVACLGLIVAALIACDRKSEIKVYRVSKAPLEEPAPEQQNAMPTNAASPPMPGGMAGAMLPRDSTAPQIKWKTPEGWSEVPPSSMRHASFNVSTGTGDKIDISVVTFPGEGGSDSDNINRWRQQIGLPLLTDEAMGSNFAQLKSGDATFATIDIAGPKARTLAAWARRDGRVWFFKATGPNAAVEKEKPNFIKFIESVRF